MIRHNRAFLIKTLYIFVDTVFIVGGVFLACYFRKHTFPFSLTFRDLFIDYSNPFQLIFLVLLIAVLFFNNLNGLYQTHREIQESVEIWTVAKSITSACVVTIVAIYCFKVENFPRSILVLTGLFLFGFLAVWRVLKRIFVEFLVERGYNNFNVLIIGAGKVGTALAEEIDKHPGFGLKIVGFLDDFKPREKEYAQHKIIGKLSDFSKIAREEFINKVFITIHHDSSVFLQLLGQARDLKIAVRVIPQGFEFTTGDFCKYNIGFIPVLEYCEEEYSIKQAGKRLFDFVVASTLLILLSPLIIVIGIMVMLDSPGSVFYFSERYGRRGKKFQMLKFRSMVRNAEKAMDELISQNDVDGPIFKIKDDPRVTKIGRFLRKFSLDELPQLINVLKGEMSLVGPRPLPIEQIEKEDLRQLMRLEVRPGITGLWQVRGRSDLSFVRLVKWDVWYINNWSFWLDFNILLQTIPVVLRGKGAY